MLSKKKEVEVLRWSASNSALPFWFRDKASVALLDEIAEKILGAPLEFFLDFSTWLKYSASQKVYLLLFSDYIQNMVS